jgi:oligoribonuclease (3'-5' exoribonuclease)
VIRYIGLDFESSGSDPWGRHAPIQIGMSVWASSSGRPFDDNFESLIGGWHFGKNGDYEWSEEAYGVHGIPIQDVQRGSGAPSLHEADVRAAAWMYDNNLKGRMWNVTVGWNVAGFDRQFITRHMPNLNRLLSYRTVDLNAIIFATASNEEHFKNLKGKAKAYANEKMRITEKQRHDALTDARAALHEFEYLRKLRSLRGPEETE